MAQKPYVYWVIPHSFRFLLGVQLWPPLYRKLRPNVGILLSCNTGEISAGDVVCLSSCYSLRLLFRVFPSVNENILLALRNIKCIWKNQELR